MYKFCLTSIVNLIPKLSGRTFSKSAIQSDFQLLLKLWCFQPMVVYSRLQLPLKSEASKKVFELPFKAPLLASIVSWLLPFLLGEQYSNK